MFSLELKTSLEKNLFGTGGVTTPTKNPLQVNFYFSKHINLLINNYHHYSIKKNYYYSSFLISDKIFSTLSAFNSAFLIAFFKTSSYFNSTRSTPSTIKALIGSPVSLLMSFKSSYLSVGTRILVLVSYLFVEAIGVSPLVGLLTTSLICYTSLFFAIALYLFLFLFIVYYKAIKLIYYKNSKIVNYINSKLYSILAGEKFYIFFFVFKFSCKHPFKMKGWKNGMFQKTVEPPETLKKPILHPKLEV